MGPRKSDSTGGEPFMNPLHVLRMHRVSAPPMRRSKSKLIDLNKLSRSKARHQGRLII